MQSKLLILLLAVAFLLIPVVLAEDTSDWNTYGQTALTAGKYTDAISYFDKALAQDKNYASALTGKAVALNALGQYDSALALANQSLLIRALDPNALNAKAYALYKLNRYDESVVAYNSLFTVQINRIDAYCNLGNAYLMINKSTEAIGSYDKCTTLDPLNFMAWNNRGLAYEGLGNYPDALSSFDQATSITVKNATIWNNKGKVLVLMGRTSDALQCFDKALGIDPGFADAKANHDSLYGKVQVVNITGTVTPTVTINRLGTYYTTVIPTEVTILPGSTTSAPAPGLTSEVTVPVATAAKKTTYSPLTPIAVIWASIAAGAIALFVKRRET
jgi:tetratricopeptide (TPR) repeat protein